MQLLGNVTVLTGMCHNITSSYHPQENGLIEQQSRTMEDCIKYTDKSQNWLELLDGMLISLHIAKHSSTKYTPSCMMYDRDQVTPF